jgi:hypothetical protein
MSGPRSISKSSLTNAADRFRKLGPPSIRGCAQFWQLQKASGKAFAAAVPRKVIIHLWWWHFAGYGGRGHSRRTNLGGRMYVSYSSGNSCQRIPKRPILGLCYSGRDSRAISATNLLSAAGFRNTWRSAWTACLAIASMRTGRPCQRYAKSQRQKSRRSRDR